MAYKILVLSEEGDALGWLCKLKSEGCQVKVYTKLPEEREAGNGILDKVTDWAPHMKWCDFAVCDSNIFGKEAEILRNAGVKVIGPTKETERSETDRAFGLSLLEDHGINCGEWSEKNLSPQEAVAFIQQNGGRWVIKPSSNADKDLTHIAADEEDAIEFLTENGPKYKGGLILQKVVEDGHEIAVSFFVSGGKIIYPLIINFEQKRLYNGDLGPNTGQQGDLCVWTTDTKLMDEVEKMEPYFAKSQYTGCFDIAFMATEEELVALEITPRFGYNTSYDIFENMYKPLGEFFYELAFGTCKVFPNSFKYATGIVLSGEGYPFKESYLKHGKGHHLKQITADYTPGMLLYSMEKDAEGFKTSGNYGAILCAVGLGDTPEESTQDAYFQIELLKLPKGIAYRTDINKKLMEEGLRWFEQHGYLPSMMGLNAIFSMDKSNI
jgi:phosphoribosylamine--glycine ligase